MTVRDETRAFAEVKEGAIIASVDIAAAPERVFAAMTSEEICTWWVRPGFFDTRTWEGDVRVGGRWRASGMGGGRPYELTGEFLEVDPPRKLVHTWQRTGSPGEPSIVSYRLNPIAGGTRVTLHHSGVNMPQMLENTSIGWETSFARLASLFGSAD